MANTEIPADDVFLPCGKVRVTLLSENATRALEESLKFARDTHWDSVRSPHLFMGLLSVPDRGVKNWGERLGADLENLVCQFKELFFQEDGELEPSLHLHREFLSDNAIRHLRTAFLRAKESKRNQVSSLDILISLLTANKSIVAECFESIGLTAAKLTELAVMAEQSAR